MIRVLLVESDLSWLKEIAQYLGNISGMRITATASSRDEAMNHLKKQDFDVVLIDINLGENRHDGIYTVAEITRISKAKIIMLTSLYEEEVIKKSFYAGAVNLVSKENYREIPSVIRSSINNFSPLEVFLKDYLRMKREERLKALTPAERQIFELMEKGYNKSQIRKILCKSESTIKNQVNKLLKKLEVSNYNEALEKVRIYAINDGNEQISGD